MRPFLLLFSGSLLLDGCRTEVIDVFDGFCAQQDMKIQTPDMTPAPAPCPAAKGLAGENLICFDFSSLGDQTLTTPPPPQLTGWDFEKFDKSCWQILNGKLQVKNFSTFMGNCGFLMLGVKPSDYQKYNNFTLSVVQTVDINKLKQSAAIYLGLPVDTQQMWMSTGTNPRQASIITVAKTALPNGGNGYQPLFQITSGITIGLTGWQIVSIATHKGPL